MKGFELQKLLNEVFKNGKAGKPIHVLQDIDTWDIEKVVWDEENDCYWIVTQ